jgi:hypothetical protein
MKDLTGQYKWTPETGNTEVIRELMARWDYCIGVVMAEGYSKEAADEIVGRFFNQRIVAA